MEITNEEWDNLMKDLDNPKPNPALQRLMSDKGLEIWSDMYNAQDKKFFECQLKLAKAERKLEEIGEIVSGDYETLDPLAKQQIKAIVDRKE